MVTYFDLCFRMHLFFARNQRGVPFFSNCPVIKHIYVVTYTERWFLVSIVLFFFFHLKQQKPKTSNLLLIVVQDLGKIVCLFVVFVVRFFFFGNAPAWRRCWETNSFCDNHVAPLQSEE